MRSRAPVTALLLLTFLGALAPTAALAAWPHDPHLAFRVVIASGSERADAALPDGAGGAIVLLEDSRNGALDVYAQHILFDGSIDPAWGAAGVAVCTAAGDQSAIQAVSDGAGGAFLCWLDHRAAVAKVYGTRLLANGTIAPGFPVDGMLLDIAGANADDPPQICTDVFGAADVVFEYETNAADHDIYGARFDGSGNLSWSGPLVVGPTMQTAPVVASEGGVFDVAWVESGTGIYVGRYITTTGAVFTTPFQFSNPAYTNASPRIAPDGDGGTIVAWIATSGGNKAPSAGRFFGGIRYAFFDNLVPFSAPSEFLGNLVYGGNYSDWLAWAQGAGPQTLYLQEITRSSGGTPISIALKADAATQLPVVAPDLLGGALAGYGDLTTGEQSYAQREMQNGLGSPALWNAPSGEGVVAGIGIVNRVTDAIVPDGGGGAIVLSRDSGFFPSRVYATRIDRWGAYDGAPSGVAVQDVAGDQGGHVRVSWAASYLDTPYASQVQAYWLWRQVPVAAALARIARGAVVERDGAAEAPAPGTLRVAQTLGQTYAWEFVVSQVADGFSSYSLTTPTFGDSVAGSNPQTAFMVEARGFNYNVGWPSYPASGYSVDNLAPTMPAPFTAQYGSGVAVLHWNPNLETDLAGYRLYRGTTTSFTIGPSSFLAARGDTGYVDAAGGPYVYKVTAIDIHGNESVPNTVTPSGTLAVGPDRPQETAFALASRNPASDGAMLRVVLPTACDMRLDVCDVTGREVRVLEQGMVDAGTRQVWWDGRDATGTPVASGLYFARLEALRGEKTVRIALSR